MENSNNFFEISEETVAAWLDGTLPADMETFFDEQLANNPELADILDAYEDIEASFENIVEEGYELPAELAFEFSIPSLPSVPAADDVLDSHDGTVLDPQDDDTVSDPDEDDSDYSDFDDIDFMS